MSELVKQLQEEGDRQSDWFNDGEATVVGGGPYLLGCAAREIERLEKEKNAAVDVGAVAAETIRDLEKEVERLRSALLKITAPESLQEARQIASDALK